MALTIFREVDGTAFITNAEVVANHTHEVPQWDVVVETNQQLSLPGVTPMPIPAEVAEAIGIGPGESRVYDRADSRHAMNVLKVW